MNGEGNNKGRYPWFCLWADPWLDGSVREKMSAEERGTLTDLLALASVSRVRGIICANEGIPYSHERIAKRLNITVDLLERTLEKSKNDISPNGTPRITEDSRGIVINNFEKYNKQNKKKKPFIPDDAKWAMATKLGIQDPKKFKTIAGNLEETDDEG